MNWISALENRPDLGVGRAWLVDQFVDSYVCWQEEAAAVKDAFECWRGADAGERGLAFAAYRAALDREDLAARAYRDCAERITGRAP